MKNEAHNLSPVAKRDTRIILEHGGREMNRIKITTTRVSYNPPVYRAEATDSRTGKHLTDSYGYTRSKARNATVRNSKNAECTEGCGCYLRCCACEG